MFLSLTLAPGVPLHRALYESLRAAMLERRLARGDLLPSTRELGQQLGISRGTVVAVFEQLRSEGYLSTRVGQGTKVANELPDVAFAASQSESPTPARVSLVPRVTRWARTMEMPFPIEGGRAPRPFQPHVPAVDAFPVELWARLVAKRARHDETLWLGSTDTSGYRPLRLALVEHLRVSRGIVTTAANVVILPSSQQALDIVARLMLEPGDSAWLEDPGYIGARAAFRASGAKLVAVPVDDRGMVVSEGVKRAAKAKLAYVTPGHQWPLGVTMAIERRLELLEWARAHRGVIIEDDYDSEFRYEGRPVAALKSLDAHDAVIHVGAFSKTMLPSLRLAYAVVPDSLLLPFLGAKSILDRHTPTLNQAGLADFIADGHFGRHVRRMRMLYLERRAALVDALTHEVGDAIEPIGSRAGLGFAIRLARSVNDVRLSELLRAKGVESMAISPTGLSRATRGGLLLGFAPYAPVRLRNAAQVLAKALEASSRE